MDNKWLIGVTINNLGLVTRYLGEYEKTRKLLMQSLILRREMNDKARIATTLSNLGDVALEQKDYPAARRFLRESLVISRELKDLTAIAYIFEYFIFLRLRTIQLHG